MGMMSNTYSRKVLGHRVIVLLKGVRKRQRQEESKIEKVSFITLNLT